MNPRSILAGLLLAALTLCVRGATEPVDLGEGLTYFRVHSVGECSAATQTALGSGRALVLDLRYATASDEDANEFGSALARRQSRMPLLILVSPATPPAVAERLKELLPPALTLGVDDSQPAARVIVAQSPEADRRAYDALGAGMKIEDLVSGKIEKERFDEASLVKEFNNGNAYAAPPPAPDPSGKPAEGSAPVLTDRVLQRAIHLHRALVAVRPRG